MTKPSDVHGGGYAMGILYGFVFLLYFSVALLLLWFCSVPKNWDRMKKRWEMRKEQRRRYYERARDRERGLEAMKGDNDTTVDNIEDKKEDESSLQEDQEVETRTSNEEMSEFHEQPKPLIEKKVD